ncbi:hypothetical protein MPTK1_8g11390 [Marchantia polymorpha subsp. ruderalis]|uniref:DUF8003 domain-containing protein n=1 Tax=Marchantia polymorpha TaxID=3197 RepID=A0A2R6XMH5_MARPO|nr:hypothetical protein MARPO_0008s0077 [Marchantia polymorpha]BBN19524.1 hypothetical protein Mp_8g11390 [Marchantia polymorpha subsp. ruderalis]|eukprot:PTQ47300.1 hypothetical protein MARPO_0008s0077 [Marchantia polymorpha]
MDPPYCLRGSVLPFFLMLVLALMSCVPGSLVENSIELWSGYPLVSNTSSTTAGGFLQWKKGGLPCDENDEDPPCLPKELVDQSLSCETDLLGIGSLDEYCVVNETVTLKEDAIIAGEGTLELLPDVTLSCPYPGCNLTIVLTGNLILNVNASVVSGTLIIRADNVSAALGSSFSAKGLGGSPPAQTSGIPVGYEGAGGGYGGRGACCVAEGGKQQEDTWGGDVYAWSSLARPWSYGSKGGSTSKKEDYGGAGGGRLSLTALNVLELYGKIDADGGSGGEFGGGGSGGSAIVRAVEIKGNGEISVNGGSGRAGGGGGRLAIETYRNEAVKLYVRGGHSLACPNNSGGAGTIFDVVPQSLTVSNNNQSTVTETLLLEFPNHPLWANVQVEGRARVLVPLLWSRMQVRGQLTIASDALLSFGLAHYSSSEFEVVAEEVLMTNAVIIVYGALKLQVKMLFMVNSLLQIEGGSDSLTSTSELEASSIAVLREGSVIKSNSNLGMHGQGLLKLNGSGDAIKAERLFISLFFTLAVGSGSVLQAPLDYDSPLSDETSRVHCLRTTCPSEVTNPSEDCTLNTSSPFTLQVCRVEDIIIEGTIKGSVVHAQRTRTISINPDGLLTASGWGCKGGLGKGEMSETLAAGGGGHGGKGGRGYFNGSVAEGGIEYGDQSMPCELGSGSGNSSVGLVTSGGGIIVLGSLDHPLASLDIAGALTVDGESSLVVPETEVGGPGGGSGGSLLLFLQSLTLQNGSLLSSAGGHGGSVGGGGGAGGRVHFHWSNIAVGEDYLAVANVEGYIHARGGTGSDDGSGGSDGTITGRECPKGLHGIFCEECPVGTYKNQSGSDIRLCKPCPTTNLPRRANFIYVRGGVLEPSCPYMCMSEKYRMPNCYTPIEELIYTLGGPWLFTILLSSALVLLALVLSVARMKLIGNDDFTGPAPAPVGGHIDHSFPFLESLNEVLETTRVEESQSHVHRMYFMGCNSFGEPWHLPHSPPEQIIDLVYEDAYNRFVEEINSLAAYQWWEGSVHSILSVLAYPFAWHWQQWRRRKKVQQLRDYVRSEYDHACLRSCRSRALYEGLKVAATPDLMLAYIDVFSGGDEKRSDLPPRLIQRLPMSIVFGGNGTYMAAYSLHSDNLLTSLICQALPATVWYRFVAGLNAQLRTVRRGSLRSTLLPVDEWLNSHVNPRFREQGIRIDLAWFQATASGYYQLGVVLTRDGPSPPPALSDGGDSPPRVQTNVSPSGVTSPGLSLLAAPGVPENFPPAQWQSTESYSQLNLSRRRIGGAILDAVTLPSLEDRKDLMFPLSILLRNLRPVGHQATVGLVISLLLLADLSLTLLTLLQFFSISLDAFLLVLLVLPLASLLPSAAGLNALFSHGPRRAAGLARVYALWNTTSFANVFMALLYGLFHYVVPQLMPKSGLTALKFNTEDDSWWLLPGLLIICKCIQAWMVDLHIANLEIQDRTLYSEDPTKFWQST